MSEHKKKREKMHHPPQEQHHQPGKESKMEPQPVVEIQEYKPAGKLKDKVAIITGGDSGIGRAVSVAFAQEGADVVVVYLDEHQDAKETQEMIEKHGRKCMTISGDIKDSGFCDNIIDQTIEKMNRLDILVNNAGEQHEQENLTEITDEQLLRTFQTNFFGMFYLTRAALKHLKKGATIVNTTSVTAYEGHPNLIDYACTKGAIVAFTRSLSRSIVDKGIRVNAVAPGPIWTPLIPASFSEKHVERFGENTPMGRPGQPGEMAPCYVFLASEDSSYMTGQVIHLNGGRFVST